MKHTLPSLTMSPTKILILRVLEKNGEQTLNKVLLARQEHIDQLGHAIYGRDSEIKKLKSQRDDLFEALKRIKETGVFLGAIAQEMVDSAIKKAEGG